MKFLNKLTCAAAVALTFAGAANAGVVMNDWKFNPDGTGMTGAQNVHEYLDVNGNSFIQLTMTGNTTFNFTEHSVFNIPQADSNGSLFPMTWGDTLSATFEAYGSGTLSGAFSFAGGTIKIYSNSNTGQYATSAGIYGADQGTLIATFTVQPGGGGLVDASGNPISNGQVTVNAMANEGDLAAGYFFRNSGEDLSTEKVLSFAFTNANPLQSPEAMLVSEVACQFSGFTGAGCDGSAYANAEGKYFFVNTNGQFKLAEVPEPGSLALFGIAMLGAGVVTRKRAKKA